MSGRLVSMAMTVFESLRRLEAGERFIRGAIESLLNQTYRNIELVILDNISNDGTFEICQEYERRDPRVRLIRDVERRPPADAGGALLSHVRGDYVMMCCDDDEYHPEYVERCMGAFERDPSTDMVYTNFQYINSKSEKLGAPVIGEATSFPRGFSPFCNACRYVIQRTPVPFGMGIFRTEVQKSIQPYFEFDSEWMANADNLFYARFFIRGHQSDFVDAPLFFYRARERTILGQKQTLSEPVTYWLRLLRHQYVFRSALMNERLHPKASPFSDAQNLVFHACLNRAFVYHSLNLFNYVKENEVAPTDASGIERMESIFQLRELLLKGWRALEEALARPVYEALPQNPQAASVYFASSIDALKRLDTLVRGAELFVVEQYERIQELISASETLLKSELDFGRSFVQRMGLQGS